MVADADGKVLLRRGADFDRLRATLPKGELKAGSTVMIEAETLRSRDLGYVPRSRQLPHDNRPPLQVTAALQPPVHDPLAPPAWAGWPAQRNHSVAVAPATAEIPEHRTRSRMIHLPLFGE